MARLSVDLADSAAEERVRLTFDASLYGAGTSHLTGHGHTGAPDLGHDSNRNQLVDASPQTSSPSRADPLATEKDRGFTGWLVTLVSFLCNGIIFGIINCYGVLYVALLDQLKSANVPNAALKCSLVGSLGTGLTFLMSAVSGVLADRIGLRRTALIGTVLVLLGLLLSSFFTTQIEVLYVGYGLMFGTGASLVYTPSLVILGHYFQRRLGFVNGVVAMGSSVFTVVMPFVMTYLIRHINISGTFQVFSGASALLIPCVLMFRPRHAPAVDTRSLQPAAHDGVGWRWAVQQILNVDIWMNRKYVLWAVAIPLGLFGYFVPYVHLVEFVRLKFPESDGTWLVPCLGLTSGVGRIVFGRIADLQHVNKIALQQVSFVVIGLMTMLLAFCDRFWLLIVIVLAMGLFDGCFVSLMGPIAFQLVGPSGASQAIGFVLTLCSIPLTTGPPVAGFLYDQTSSYTLAFCLAGCPPIVAAVIMCFIHRIPQTDPRQIAKQQLAADVAKEGATNVRV